MIKIGKYTIPGIGQRMVRSAMAVLLCFAFYIVFRPNGVVFYSQLAALWCIQPHPEHMINKAVQRTIGTVIGAVYALAILLIDQGILMKHVELTGTHGQLIYALIVSAGVLAALYTTILIHKSDASYFSCVVLLSAAVVHIGDSNPYLFVFNRALDTMIGIAIGMCINMVHLPRRRDNKTLFVSGMDGALLSMEEKLSPYSTVELNRMLKDGVQFTVATKRTPASLMDPLAGINLKLPVIAMDGAVIYDIRERRFEHIYRISKETTSQLEELFQKNDMNYFLSQIIDETLFIYYQKLKNDAERDIYNQLHRSPYRNYTHCNMTETAASVYFMLIDKHDKIHKMLEYLEREGFTERLRVVSYASSEYEGFSYIKIYNRNATRKNAIEYMKQRLGAPHVVIFGSREGISDIVIEEKNTNQVVKKLKQLYEPLLWSKKK